MRAKSPAFSLLEVVNESKSGSNVILYYKARQQRVDATVSYCWSNTMGAGGSCSACVESPGAAISNTLSACFTKATTECKRWPGSPAYNWWVSYAFPGTIGTGSSCDKPYTSQIVRHTNYSCPDGYTLRTDTSTYCYNGASATIAFTNGYRVTPDDNPQDDPDRCEGNPCDAIGGGKRERAVDYQSPLGLDVERYFSTAMGSWRFGFDSTIKPRSLSYLDDTALAVKSTTWPSPEEACTGGWREVQARTAVGSASNSTWDGKQCKVYVDGRQVGVLRPYIQTAGTAAEAAPQLAIHRPNGTTYYFEKSGAAWVPLGGNTAVAVEATATGYLLRTKGGRVEEYDANGRLTAYTDDGRRFTICRANNQVVVADPFGHRTSASYTNGQVSRVDLPDGSAVNYTYAGTQLTRAEFVDAAGQAVESESYGYETRGPQTLLTEHRLNDLPYATWAYDDAGRVTSSQHAGGAEGVVLEYKNGYTKITRATGSTRVLWNASVRGSARFAQDADMDGKLYEQNTYDSNGFLQTRTDALGNLTTCVHDSLGRETSRTEAAGTAQARTITTTWDTQNPYRAATVTTPTLSTSYTYDGAGRTLSKTEIDLTSNRSRIWTFSYDANGLLLSTDGPRTDVADVTQFQYDSAGLLSAVIDALGHTTSITAHDGNGRPTTIVDPNGLTTTLAYDARGRLTRKSVGTEVTQMAYTAAGDLQTLNLPTGEQYTYSYDAARRLTAIVDSAGNRIDYTLDAMGNQTEQTVKASDGTVTRHLQQVFDSLGRLTQSIAASGAVTAYGYDENGNQTSVTDGLGHTTTRAYDALNRLAQVTDALGGQVTYGYDTAGELTSVTDPNGNTTSYTINGFGQRVRQQSPDTGVTTFTYDLAGNVTSRTDAKGQTATYRYDALNRLVEAEYVDGTITYTYDTAPNGVGRLAGFTDMSGSTAYEYDTHGRVAVKRQTVGSVTLTTTYAHDSAGRLTQVTYPSGMVVGYGYALGKVAGVTVNGSAALSGVAYEAFGDVKGWTLGNGQAYQRTFDLDGQMTQLLMGNETRTLGRDLLGNITSLQDGNNSSQFGYDVLNRLTSANDPAFNLAWTYDANGNRLQQTSGSDVTIYNYASASNRLAAIDGNVYAVVNHDLNGNRTGDGNHSYQYDARDRVVSVDSGATAAYVYNALGQRVRKQVSADSRVFAYDEAGQLLGEYAGNAEQETVWVGDLPVVTEQGGAHYYIHPDHLATPRVIADQSGRTVWRWDSEPFGSGAANEDVDGDGVAVGYGVRFPGQYYDYETGLHYNYFRDYDPSAGRYIESDPIGLKGGLNTFAYVDGNPVKTSDQRGLLPSSCTASPQAAATCAEAASVNGSRSSPVPTPVPANDPDEDDDVKVHCRVLYERCIQETWGGDWSCNACHFYCTGINKEWPFWHCSPDKKRCN